MFTEVQNRERRRGKYTQSNTLNEQTQMLLQRMEVDNSVSQKNETIPTNTVLRAATEPQSIPAEIEQKSIDPQQLAEQVYNMLLNRLDIEKERRGF